MKSRELVKEHKVLPTWFVPLLSVCVTECVCVSISESPTNGHMTCCHGSASRPFLKFFLPIFIQNQQFNRYNREKLVL